MITVYENLKNLADSIIVLLNDLKNHSTIRSHQYNSHEEIVLIGRAHYWNLLGSEGRPIQAKTLDEYRRFFALIKILLSNQPDITLAELDECDKTILDVIQQEYGSWFSNIDDAFNTAIEGINKQVELLKRLYDISEGIHSVIPDTNALLYNPYLEKWRFDDFQKFTIILTPTVLSELDELKVNHRVESVRSKSEKLIRQIKEYRRRGKLTEGVTLVNGISKIEAFVIEPKLKESLPWLDENNKDDRLLSGVIEIMRLRPFSPVILVTRDINLQNKAEFAQVPFVEPPDPKNVNKVSRSQKSRNNP